MVAQSGNGIGTVAGDDVLAQPGREGVVSQRVHDLERRYVSNVGDDVIRLRV